MGHKDLNRNEHERWPTPTKSGRQESPRADGDGGYAVPCGGPPMARFSVSCSSSSSSSRESALSISSRDRIIPGEGCIDFRSFFGAVEAAGFSGPMVLEIFSAKEYPTNPHSFHDQAGEDGGNEQFIENVFQELNATRPEGVRCLVVPQRR